MTQINTQENGYSFEDAIARHIETLGGDLDVTYDESTYQFTVTEPSGESFDVQVCPTADIPGDTMVCGLFNMQADAPTVEVDGEEYTIIRQW